MFYHTKFYRCRQPYGRRVGYRHLGHESATPFSDEGVADPRNKLHYMRFRTKIDRCKPNRTDVRRVP